MNLIPKPGLPTHLDLPDKDDSVVENFFEMPQTMLLTETIKPVLAKFHPDGQYAIGGGSLIYFRFEEEQPLRGCRAPDWFYVPGVPPLAEDGQVRRSYVLWQEHVRPTIVLEFASADGSEERDDTPQTGKFWIYEREIRSSYYGIFIEATGELEMYRLSKNRFQRMKPNALGRYPVPEMEVELGLWSGRFVIEAELTYMRWYDQDGQLLPTGKERADLAEQRTAQAEQRNAQLAAKLRELGIDPDKV
jgi:hypothetical protein